jgi:hypothetical protein
VEFRLKGSPTMSRSGSRVAPDYGGRGGAREYMSTDPVEVEIINVEPCQRTPRVIVSGTAKLILRKRKNARPASAQIA